MYYPHKVRAVASICTPFIPRLPVFLSVAELAQIDKTLRTCAVRLAVAPPALIGGRLPTCAVRAGTGAHRVPGTRTTMPCTAGEGEPASFWSSPTMPAFGRGLSPGERLTGLL